MYAFLSSPSFSYKIQYHTLLHKAPYLLVSEAYSFKLRIFSMILIVRRSHACFIRARRPDLRTCTDGRQVRFMKHIERNEMLAVCESGVKERTCGGALCLHIRSGFRWGD